jgi:hypothetical protein
MDRRGAVHPGLAAGPGVDQSCREQEHPAMKVEIEYCGM